MLPPVIMIRVPKGWRVEIPSIQIWHPGELPDRTAVEQHGEEGSLCNIREIVIQPVEMNMR